MHGFRNIKLWQPSRKPPRCLCCGRRSYKTCSGSDTIGFLLFYYVRSLRVERLPVYPYLNLPLPLCLLLGKKELQEAGKSKVSFNFLDNYLHSPVKPFFILCKVFMTCKSVRVAQLASKVAFFVCGAKIIRQATDVFDTLYLTRGLRIHCCFLKCFIEPFSKQSCSEINALKVWFNDAINGVNNRAEEQ